MKLDIATGQRAEYAAVPTPAGVDDLHRQRHRESTKRAETVRNRHFLFVSAPFGPFSRQLAAELRKSDAMATRVILNAGDLFDWGTRNAVPYFGSSSGWAEWLKGAIKNRQVTDVVTHGDSNPFAASTLAVAAEFGIAGHVLEHGYFRPNWVTLEAGGANANSRLPRDSAWYRNHRAARIPIEVESLAPTTPAAVWYITVYHAAMYAGLPFFPRFRAHYKDSAFKQAIGHVVRYGLRPMNQTRDRRVFEELTSTNGPIFLCALQRPGDSQLWRHSDFASISDFIEHVAKSFAANAPRQARLAIRPHPLDPGLVSYSPIVSTVARRYGLEGRIAISDYGKLHEILPRISGVVCINSTAGLAAIEFGKPTIVLGRANYDIVGMTHQGDLDTFWQAPQAPDPEMYSAFRRVLMAETQINGAFATKRGRQLAVPEIALRLLAVERFRTALAE